MSEFNPYTHWLGFTGKEKPETYYELLGLPYGEKNVQKIAKVVEEMTAKVQKAGPDGHFPEWNQMLTEIQVAKNCLCNPKYKADYDAKHPAPAASGQAPVMPQQTTAPQPDPQAQVQAQAMGQPQPGAYPGMQPGMYPAQPGMYPGMQPGMYSAQTGMYPGMQPGMYVQPGMYPGMQPGMQPGMYVQPGMQPGMYMQPGMMPQQPVQPQPMPQVMPQPAVAPTPVQPAANPLEGVDLFGTGSSSTPSTAPAPSAPAFSPVPVSASKPSVKSSAKSSAKARKAQSSGPTPMQRNIIAVVGLLIVAILAFMLMNKKKPIEVAIQEDGSVAVNVNNPLDPENQVPETPVPETAAPASEPSAEKVAPATEDAPKVAEGAEGTQAFENPDFDVILADVRSQLYNEADQKLKAAAQMKLSPENTERLGRVELVAKHAEIFYNEMMNSLAALKGKVPAELCNGEYGLVEASEKRIVIRIEGKNIKFTKEQPTRQGHNLYDIIYRHEFAKQVDEGNMTPALCYAVFEFLSPDSDQDKAMKLLETVNEKGNDEDREKVKAILAELGPKPVEVAQAPQTPEEPKQDVAQLEEEKAAPAEEKAETSGTAEEEKDAKTAEKSSKKKSKKLAKEEEKEAEAKAKEAEEAEKKAKDEALAKERHENEWKQIAASIRQDLGWQRISQAKRNLNELSKIAKTDEEKEEAARLETITDYLDIFIKGVGNQMGKFTPASSVTVSGKELGIVESAPGRLVVREEGVNKTYTTENLNPKLVEFLVGKNLKEADDYILYGTYLAMDPEGDRAKAKSYWNTAVSKEAGKKETVEILMKELDVPLVDAGKRPTQANVAGRPGKQMEQRTVPIGADHDKALEELKNEFAKEYEKKDPVSQKKLAEKFVKQAQLPKTPSAQAYVMAEEATRIGKENSFFEIACQGMMVHELIYQRDTYQERFDFLKKANPEARGNASESDFSNCAIAMGFDCVQRGKKIDANQMLNMARDHVKGSQVKKMKQLEMAINQMK